MAVASKRALPQFYDKIIFFNYNGASPSKKAAHATSVLNLNGITVAPARARLARESITTPGSRNLLSVSN